MRYPSSTVYIDRLLMTRSFPIAGQVAGSPYLDELARVLYCDGLMMAVMMVTYISQAMSIE